MNLIKKIFVTLRAVANHPLTRSSKLKSILDFSVAQVAVRLVPGDICVPFPNQSRLLISPRMKGAAHFITPGLCEFEEMCFVLHSLRPEDLFIDVGANVGAYSVLASAVVGARTISCEPSPFSFAFLLQNLRLNDLTARMTALNVALGSKEGVLRLTEGLGTENYISLNGDVSNTTEVKVNTLDKLLQDLNPCLIKMDVEGFEAEVIAGAKDVLQKPSLQAFIIERTGVAQRYGFDEAALHQQFRAQSWIPCAYCPAQRSLTQIPEEAHGNIIYVREMQAVQARLREAPPFRFRNTFF